MGCCQSNSIYSKVSVENKELGNFEKSWGLGKVKSAEIELVVRRNFLTPTAQLVSIINSHFSSNIPEKLLVHSSLSFEEILTFFVLVGYGNHLEKCEALWYVYDNCASGEIEGNVFSSLMKAVVKVSVSVSLGYYVEVNKSALIVGWHQQLNERISSLCEKLVKHFLEEKKALKFSEFLDKCRQMPQGNISDLSAIRTQLEHTQVIPTRFANPFKTMKIKRLDT